MKKFLKIIILPIATIILLGGFASTAFAQPLVVQFVPNPLFDKPNFLPNDETSGVVTVTNNSDTTQTIATEAINVFDNNNFGSLLHLKIVGSSGTLFDNSLANFLSTAGEVSLGTIGSGESKTFTYTISFLDSSDNSYQGKTLGFDVCVGFLGGQTNCGDTVVGGEGNTGGNDGGGTGGTGGGIGGDQGGGILLGTSGGGGGGGGNGPIVPTTLRIFNEQASNISANGIVPGSGVATITWETNLLATSQVVYGPDTTTYTFDINNLPAFGYPSYTGEDATKVIFHSMLLTGLTPGQTYVYRVVSRASPPTVSYEHQFTVPIPGQESGITLATNTTGAGVASANTGLSQGSVLGTETTGAGNEEKTSSTTGTAGVSNGNLATAFLSGFGDILSVCSLIALLILLLLYLIWRLWLRKRYEKNNIPEEQIKTRFFVFFGLASALAIIICFILGNYCPIPVFVLSLIVCLCIYLYRFIEK